MHLCFHFPLPPPFYVLSSKEKEILVTYAVYTFEPFYVLSSKEKEILVTYAVYTFEPFYVLSSKEKEILVTYAVYTFELAFESYIIYLTTHLNLNLTSH